MTDAQHLVQYAQRQFDEITASIERHFDQVAGQLRESFSHQRPPTPPKRLPPPTTYQSIERLVLRNKALTAAAVAFLVTGSIGAVVYINSQDMKRKRRARKSPSGARTDVVVVAGAVANPLTSALYLDLERRGFVVYVVTNTPEDEHYIRSQSRSDLHILSIHPGEDDPYITHQDSLDRFRHMLSHEHRAFDHAEPHKLHLRGLILVPDTSSSPPLPIADIRPSDWSDALNTRLLNPITTTQLFLPILQPGSKILLLTPSVTPSLQLPLHSPETTTYHALESFLRTLSTETKASGIQVSHFKLGNIDIPAVTARQKREGIHTTSRFKPTPLRQLHDAVFDQLVAKKANKEVFVGRGSWTYHVIGKFMPSGLVGWMMAPSTAKKGTSNTASGGRKELGNGSASDDERLASSTGSITWEKVDQQLGE
ncbi:hypothetical protein CB0940_04028 [Cercospora beticola]|uniref:Uncharacterized protein n=1 Tax=Cercospora beticola TaxID=122368 RepID=A0A2G5HMR6_CERBT|nr:hypothetical protein CB0940_04028 [Cercospora beticola]PIA93788.1 hypothetical protein CB0940_04028 [Cercospora beticola]WPB01237.1 hypothetical protein RHO25_005860 [Cercospora beticola]CAK1364002.1 unnamed protein product [Cercospora beticola]